MKSFLDRIKPISIGSAMADLALLLLIFFMATTTTEPPKGVDVELPKAETEGAEQESIFITISNKGKIYYDGVPVSLQKLYDSLESRSAEKDKVVSITADKSLPYEDIAKVLTVLQDKDFLNIVFMSQSRKEHENGD